MLLFVLRAIFVPAHPSVKVVYLVPSDVSPSEDFPEGAHRAVVAVQRWYFDALANGETFTLADPLVTTVQTAHPQSWYSEATRNVADREALWSAVMEEAFSLTGGSYNDSHHIWLYFLDADLPGIPPQGTPSVALLLRKDILELSGSQPRCSVDGTIAHELGHAFGLKHPAECDSRPEEASGVVCESMSFLGSWDFPRTGFLSEERARLLQSPGFAAVKPGARSVECSN